MIIIIFLSTYQFIPPLWPRSITGKAGMREIQMNDNYFLNSLLIKSKVATVNKTGDNNTYPFISTRLSSFLTSLPPLPHSPPPVPEHVPTYLASSAHSSWVQFPWPYPHLA